MAHFYRCLLFALLLYGIVTDAGAQKINMDSLVSVTDRMPNDTAKAMGYITISNKFRTENIQYPLAEKYAKDGLLLAQKLGFTKGVFFANMALGYLYRDMGKRQEGIDFLKTAITAFEGNKKMLADESLRVSHINAYTAVSEMYLYITDFANAEKWAFKAMALSEKYKSQMGQCWITLSMIFSRQKNLPQAKLYAEKALDYFRQQNATADVARVYAFLGSYAFAEQQLDKAIGYYNSSYQYYQSANSMYGMRIAMYNLSNIYLQKKDYSKADEWIAATKKITSENDIISNFHIHQLLFNIELEKENYPAAVNAAEKAIGYAGKEKNFDNLNAALTNLLKVRIAMRDTAQAYLISSKINALKDSIYNSSLAKSSSDITRRYEYEKQQQQIELLNTENRLKEALLQQQHALSAALQSDNLLRQHQIEQDSVMAAGLERENELQNKNLQRQATINKQLELENTLMAQNQRIEKISRWLMIIALLAITAFCLNYYLSWKRQQKANKRIKKYNSELEYMMKEIHHRVKNNLQFMVSMLRLQGRGITDPAALKLLESAESRLQTIAVLHDKFHSAQQHQNIVIKDYLEEILRLIAGQFQQMPGSFSFSVTDHANFVTDAGTAIPLGLIVNELASNAFKHAFDGLEQKEIKVVLTKTPKGYELSIQDNGPGIDEALISKPDGLGLKLVHLFAEQLNGKLQYHRSGGSVFKVSFSKVDDVM